MDIKIVLNASRITIVESHKNAQNFIVTMTYQAVIGTITGKTHMTMTIIVAEVEGTIEFI